MTELLGVNPAELRWVSKRLAHVSELMRDAREALQDMLNEEGEAWGTCKVGRRFADGAQGYCAQAEEVDGSLKAKDALLDFYADGLRVIADALEQQDSTWM